MEGTPQSNWSFGEFFLGIVAVELALTPMFEVARGSILIPMLYHFQLNGPTWPDAQPYDSYLFIVVAVVIVVLNRRRMFTRMEVPIDVVPPAVADAVSGPALRAAEPSPDTGRVAGEGAPIVP